MYNVASTLRVRSMGNRLYEQFAFSDDTKCYPLCGCSGYGTGVLVLESGIIITSSIYIDHKNYGEYNRKLINRICDFYADNAVVHSICNQDQIGHDEIQGAIVSLLSSFPNARMIVDRVTCNDNADGSWHVSARWRLRGLHEGIGMYGIPTGKPVEIMGITQYRFENGKIVEAWEIYDGLDVMRQLSLGNESTAEMQ